MSHNEVLDMPLDALQMYLPDVGVDESPQIMSMSPEEHAAFLLARKGTN